MTQDASEIFFSIVKPAVYLLLVYAILSIVAGAYLPLGGNPLVGMGVWFVLLIVATIVLCRFAYHRRIRILGSEESLADFLEESLTALLGILGAGPFSVLMLVALRNGREPLRISDPALVIGLVAALLFGLSVRSMFRLLTRK